MFLKIMIPKKLKKGDEIRIIAPSRSLSLPWILNEIQNNAIQKLKKLGLKITFSKNVREIDEYDSSSIRSRVNDLHEAFKDSNVKAILTVIGGYNSIELLPYLNYKLIKKNPKILCGYSDITILLNGIYEKTKLITYYGPHFFDFGESKNFNYTQEYFKKCLFSNNSYKIKFSKKWSDDRWGKDQKNRKFFTNKGGIIINPGVAEGNLIGGNLCSFQLLQGTNYFPKLKNTILMIEDIDASSLNWFNRDLNSLTLNKEFGGVRGILIGRFQVNSKIKIDSLKKMIKNNIFLKNIPIVANIDFGHTTPKATFPIGGICKLKAIKNTVDIRILKH